MEAISHGLPIVCFDSCGYGPVVDERIGIRIPVSKPDESVRLFVGAIRKLVSSPQKMDELSSNTQEKVASLTWDAKIREVLSIYFSL
jgi:glycosyltransferase involved in cell wall biosynthesis